MKKEKIDREIRVVVQKSLYDLFKKTCVYKYKTISEAIRELMLEFIDRNREKINAREKTNKKI